MSVFGKRNGHAVSAHLWLKAFDGSKAYRQSLRVATAPTTVSAELRRSSGVPPRRLPTLPSRLLQAERWTLSSIMDDTSLSDDESIDDIGHRVFCRGSGSVGCSALEAIPMQCRVSMHTRARKNRLGESTLMATLQRSRRSGKSP